MAKSLTNLRAQTRTYLDEVTTADWTETEVDREINYKYMELYAAIVEVYEDYYSTKSATNTIEDQQEYSLPTDLWKIRRVEINYDVAATNSTPSRALRVTLDDVLRDLNNNTLGITVHSAAVYYVRGNTLGFIPIPERSETAAINIWYIKIPDELSAATDVIDIPFPDRYGQLISLGAAGALLRKGQQEEAVAKQYLFDFEEGVKKMQRELEDRLADGARSITDTLGYDVSFDNFSTI